MKRKLADASREKRDLEATLEAEQDFVVNRLQRSLHAAQAATARAETALANLGSDKSAATAISTSAIEALPPKLLEPGVAELLESAIRVAIQREVESRMHALRQVRFHKPYYNSQSLLAALLLPHRFLALYSCSMLQPLLAALCTPVLRSGKDLRLRCPPPEH